MGIIVSKFGGSSTANAENLKRIERLVRASPARRCTVLSAPGADGSHPYKVTALLERCWELRKSPVACEGAVSAVVERFHDICLGLDIPDMSPLVRRSIEQAISISLPHTLSRGEYLCAKVFSRRTGLPMMDAAGLIVFDAGGELDEDATRRSIRQLTHFDRPVVVPGLMTADPAYVPQARLIPHIGYRQMRALSRAGAHVLHPACLDPVAMAGIPTRLRDTMRPDSFGTLIDERCDRPVPCIAGQHAAFLPDGRPSARITVFALPPDRVLDAAAPLAPLGMIAGRDQTVIYLPAESYRDGLLRLHRALIEEPCA